jgi:hypothetical protein
MNPNGTPIGGEFQVNKRTAGDQMNPAIGSSDMGGSFIIVWHSTNRDGSGKAIVGRKFKPDGSPDGREFLVNSFKRKDQITPAIAVLRSGQFIVVWVSDGQDGSGSGVYAQRFRP